MKWILEKETHIWWKTVLWEKGSGTSENLPGEVCSLPSLQQEFSWDPHLCPCLGLIFQLSQIPFVQQHFSSHTPCPCSLLNLARHSALGLCCYWEPAAKPVSSSLTVMSGEVWWRGWAMVAIKKQKQLRFLSILHDSFLAMSLLLVFSISSLFYAQLLPGVPCFPLSPCCHSGCLNPVLKGGVFG